MGPSGSVSDLSPELDGISIQENTGSTLRSSSVVMDQSQPEQGKSSRIRSSSFNDHDLTEQTSKGVNPTSQRAGTTSSSSSVEGSRDRTERSVQLNTREVKALKMGLEQATAKNKTQQKEEEEEKRAAELEKKKRATVS